MGTKVELTVVTPERVVYKDEVDLVIARGSEGELAVLFDHAPLVTTIKESELKVKKDKKYYPIAISRGGYLEIKPEKVTILADAAELPEEIDVERAMAAKKRAEERLRRQEDENIDFERARSALQRALVRLRVAEHVH